MKLLEGKTAIITGASKGIGKGLAQMFVQHGANVAFTYLSSVEKGEALEKELATDGVQVKGYRSDASNMAQAEELIKNVLADFGGIDIVVNNAGITKDNLLMRMSEDDFNRVVEVNLNSVFNMTKAVQRTMLKQRKGSIITISSVVGVKGNAGQANYAASKAGAIGFSKSIALELGSRNIRCNVIAPGFIETDLIRDLPAEQRKEYTKQVPVKRFGTVEEVAHGVLFLASKNAGYITGTSLTIAGGL